MLLRQVSFLLVDTNDEETAAVKEAISDIVDGADGFVWEAYRLEVGEPLGLEEFLEAEVARRLETLEVGAGGHSSQTQPPAAAPAPPSTPGPKAPARATRRATTPFTNDARIIDYLKEHGPCVSTTLERELQLSKGTLRTMLKRLSSSKEGKVAIVGKHAKAGGGPQAHIWGLPGSIPSSSLANAGAVVEAPPKPQPPTRPLAPIAAHARADAARAARRERVVADRAPPPGMAGAAGRGPRRHRRRGARAQPELGRPLRSGASAASSSRTTRRAVTRTAPTRWSSRRSGS